MRYRRNEAVEKKVENVTLATIEAILQPDHLKGIIENAKDCIGNSDARPATLKDLPNLRDVLITQLMIKTLRDLWCFRNSPSPNTFEMEEIRSPKTNALDCHVL